MRDGALTWHGTLTWHGRLMRDGALTWDGALVGGQLSDKQRVVGPSGERPEHAHDGLLHRHLRGRRTKAGMRRVAFRARRFLYQEKTLLADDM